VEWTVVADNPDATVRISVEAGPGGVARSEEVPLR